MAPGISIKQSVAHLFQNPVLLDPVDRELDSLSSAFSLSRLSYKEDELALFNQWYSFYGKLKWGLIGVLGVYHVARIGSNTLFMVSSLLVAMTLILMLYSVQVKINLIKLLPWYTMQWVWIGIGILVLLNEIMQDNSVIKWVVPLYLSQCQLLKLVPMIPEVCYMILSIIMISSTSESE